MKEDNYQGLYEELIRLIEELVNEGSIMRGGNSIKWNNTDLNKAERLDHLKKILAKNIDKLILIPQKSYELRQILKDL